jgi:hypothetical protein
MGVAMTFNDRFGPQSRKASEIFAIRRKEWTKDENTRRYLKSVQENSNRQRRRKMKISLPEIKLGGKDA